MTLSGIFRDLLPLQTRMLAEAAYKWRHRPMSRWRKTLSAPMRWPMPEETGVDTGYGLAQGVFQMPKGPTAPTSISWSTVPPLAQEDELADAYEARKSFAYGRDGKAMQQTRPYCKKTLKNVELAYQNLESVELGVTSVDHYFDTLGGIARAVKRHTAGQIRRVYISDQTRGDWQGAHPARSGCTGNVGRAF